MIRLTSGEYHFCNHCGIRTPASGNIEALAVPSTPSRFRYSVGWIRRNWRKHQHTTSMAGMIASIGHPLISGSFDVAVDYLPVSLSAKPQWYVHFPSVRHAVTILIFQIKTRAMGGRCFNDGFNDADTDSGWPLHH
jgi:hypothetical protein